MAETTVTPNPQGGGLASQSGEDLTGRLIGGCLIGQKIGQGGMGAVYKAFHQALDIDVAVKILLPYPGMGKDAAGRFIREARAAAKLRHPNITGVLNVGEEGGVSFIVMELLTGGSLQAMLDKSSPLPPKHAVDIVLHMLDALTLAYENRIVHRDIKPDNILFDSRGAPKLSDLGLAKQVGTDLSLTQSGVAMGSPHYMAPEQATDFSKADHRADIYSLGCVLYHAVTGKPPYGGTTRLEVILKHINQETPDLQKAAPHVPKGLAAIVARMMAKNPEERFQTPMEAAAALQPFADSTHAPRPGNAHRGNRLVLIVSGAAAALIIVCGAMLLLRRQHNEIVVSAGNTAGSALPAKTGLHDKIGVKDPATPRVAVQPGPPHNPSRRPSARPSVPSTDARGKANPLMSAVRDGRNKDLRALLNKGSQPNVVENGTTPLHVAVAKGDADAVRILLEKGANPSTLDDNGESPLHLAVRAGSGALALELLNFGSNPNIRDGQGMTPLQLAHGAGIGEIARMLREHGGH